MAVAGGASGGGAHSATDGGAIDVSAPARIQGTITTALDTQTFTFTGVKGQELSLNVTASNGSCQVKDQWGFTVGIWSTGTDTPVDIWSQAGCRVFGPSELPADGPYELRVTSIEASPGKYQVALGIVQ